MYKYLEDNPHLRESALIILCDLALMIGVIISSVIFFNIFTGYFINTIILKLVKPSFEYSIENSIDLAISYFVSLVIFLQLISPFIPIPNVSVPLDSQKYIIMCFGLALIYFGRFTTRINGVSYGMTHYIGLFILSSFYGFVASGIWLLDKINHANGLNAKDLIDISNILWIGYLDFISESVNHNMSYGIGFILGIVAISTLGEYYLGGYTNYPLTAPNKRSLMQVIDKLPSDFEIITGKSDTIAKLDCILNTKKSGIGIKSLRCITKSCTLVENIYNVDEKYGTLRGNPNCMCKIIKCNDHNFYADLNKSVENLPIPWNFIMDKDYNYFEGVNEYRDRIYNIRLKLDRDLGSKHIEIENCYLDELRYAIFECDNGQYKMLIISKEKSPFRPSRVGLYTEQIYIINEFIKLFDSLWHEIKQRKEDREGNLESNLPEATLS